MPIDLRSDTVTKPTPAMRLAMADAEVGDDERDGDPTMGRLEARVAAMLGKDVALFFPSGTMANQAAVWAHTTPATEVFLDANAHIVDLELAGIAALSGTQIRPVVPTGRVMNTDDLRRALRPASRYYPAPSLVCVENTHSGAGGVITPAAELRQIRDLAAEHGLSVHLDGARLWNAAIASGTPLAEFAECAETVMVAFSKGLGAPIGAAVAGSRAIMDDVWTARKLLGGAMRQCGILAAAALYALDHHMDRLADDHANARRLAAGLEGVPGVSVAPPDSNIVMVDVATGMTADHVVAAAARNDVLLAPWTRTRLRLVTHLDVSTADVDRACEVIRWALSES